MDYGTVRHKFSLTLKVCFTNPKLTNKSPPKLTNIEPKITYSGIFHAFHVSTMATVVCIKQLNGTVTSYYNSNRAENLLLTNTFKVARKMGK